MKKYLILSLLLAGCAQSQQSSSSVANEKIVAFGDSHTYGVMAQPLSWADHLTKSLNKGPVVNRNYASALNSWHTLDNQAMGGTKFSSFWQYERIMKYQFRMNDVVIMLLGYNDNSLNGTDAVKLELFKTNLRAALNKIDQVGAKAFVGTCIRATPASYELTRLNGISAGVDLSGASASNCDTYAQATRDVVAEFQSAVLIDTNNLITVTDADLLDGIHFKFNIHEKISDLFNKAIVQ